MGLSEERINDNCMCYYKAIPGRKQAQRQGSVTRATIVKHPIQTVAQTMESTNEELIRRFAAIRAKEGEEGEEGAIVLTEKTVQQRDWNLCAVDWIITDKSVSDPPTGEQCSADLEPRARQCDRTGR